MTRARSSVLSLIVAVGMGAALAAAAQASTEPVPPEFARCEKVAKGKEAQYTNAACTLKGPKGKFEALPVAPGTAYSAQGGKAVLETESGITVSCKSTSDSGEITGPKTVLDTVTFAGCESASLKETCQNSGSKEGEIRTAPLEVTLGFIDKASEEVGEDSRPLAPNTIIASFECGGEGAGPNFISITGASIGTIAPVDKMTTSFKAVLKGPHGKQEVEELEGGTKETPVATVCANECTSVGAAETATDTVTTKEKIEVRASVAECRHVAFELGPQFYATEAECASAEKPGSGEWELAVFP